MDTIEAFAAEVRRFKSWADDPAEGDAGARAALVRVVALYQAALSLPEPWHPDVEAEPEPSAMPLEEWKAVYGRLRSTLPVGFYGMVFDPLVIPPKEAVIGEVGDDLADIYRDVVVGLLAFDSGARLLARYEWGFNFRIHWGEHALHAMRALHAYLATEAHSALSAGGQPIVDRTSSRDPGDERAKEPT